jgi:hypothetical protein
MHRGGVYKYPLAQKGPSDESLDACHFPAVPDPGTSCDGLFAGCWYSGNHCSHANFQSGCRRIHRHKVGDNQRFYLGRDDLLHHQWPDAVEQLDQVHRRHLGIHLRDH